MLRQIYRARAELLRAALERAYQAPVVPIVGTFWDYRADA